MEDVQWVLRKVGRLESLPPAGDGLIENPRPPFSHQEWADAEEDEATERPAGRLTDALRWLRGRAN